MMVMNIIGPQKNNNIKKGKDQDIEDKKHYICEYEYT